MKISKTYSLISVTLFGLLPQIVSASVFSCPNTQLGAFSGQTGAPVIYSDCAVTASGMDKAQLWLAGLGSITVPEGSGVDDFSPQSATLNIGDYEPGFNALADIGSGYAGQCGDIDAPSSEDRASIDGHSYCTHIATTAGHTLRSRGHTLAVMMQLAAYFDPVVRQQSASWHFWLVHRAFLSPGFAI